MEERSRKETGSERRGDRLWQARVPRSLTGTPLSTLVAKGTPVASASKRSSIRKKISFMSLGFETAFGQRGDIGCCSRPVWKSLVCDATALLVVRQSCYDAPLIHPIPFPYAPALSNLSVLFVSSPEIIMPQPCLPAPPLKSVHSLSGTKAPATAYLNCLTLDRNVCKVA